MSHRAVSQAIRALMAPKRTAPGNGREAPEIQGFPAPGRGLLGPLAGRPRTEPRAAQGTLGPGPVRSTDGAAHSGSPEHGADACPPFGPRGRVLVGIHTRASPARSVQRRFGATKCLVAVFQAEGRGF